MEFENPSQVVLYGNKFGQAEETYNIVAAHGYFGRLIFPYAGFNNSRSLHFFLAAVVRGPADRPLKIVRVELDGDRIWLDFPLDSP